MKSIDLNEIPPGFRDTYCDIVALTDDFCDQHLNDEYKQLCREMALCMCVEDTPITRGKRASWAAGIVHAVGWVNFLSDPSVEPNMPPAEVAKAFGVSQGTMTGKSKVLREGLELMPFHPEWCLPSLMDDNPLAWMVETNEGYVVDARNMPTEFQQAAFAQGLIPYLPAPDQQQPPATEAPRDDILGRIGPGGILE